MTVVAPRSASVPTGASSSPVAVDRAPMQGPHDFETVLRGRSGRRMVPSPAGADGRDHRADSSPGEGADRAAAPPSGATGSVTPSPPDPAASPGAGCGPATDPGAGAQPAVPPRVQVTAPAPARLVAAADATTAAPGPVAAAAASAVAAATTTATAATTGPVATGATLSVSDGAVSASSGTPGTVASGLPVLRAGKRSDPAGAREGGEHAPTTVAAGSAAPAAASTASDATAYPVPTPGTPGAGGSAPVATPAGGRPAQATLPPQAQVLNAVSPLVTTADGTHRLTVHLAPAHLGSVQVHLEVAGGEVTLRLTVADPATGDALRQSAAELRSHLERLGLRAGGFDVQVAPGDPTRAALRHAPAGQATTDQATTGQATTGQATTGQATTDRGDRGSGQRDPGPSAGPQTADGHGDAPSDGTWHRHERPLEGWAPRDADRRRPGRLPPVEPTDPHRPPLHDVRVDVRM